MQDVCRQKVRSAIFTLSPPVHFRVRGKPIMKYLRYLFTCFLSLCGGFETSLGGRRHANTTFVCLFERSALDLLRAL